MKPTQEQDERCTWTEVDCDSDIYATSCGHYFAITELTPYENKMRFCCYCGKSLEQMLFVDDY